MQAFLEGNADLEPRSCSHCQQVVAASKKLQLYMLPDVLVLSLKRFEQTWEGTKKLETMVEFPVEGWDMSAYVQHPQVSAYTASGTLTYVQCRSNSDRSYIPLH